MNKSKVFKLAHSVRSEFPTFADALRFAWAKVKISTKLAKGLCYFTFTKKSTGEERAALGTTNMLILSTTTTKDATTAKNGILQTFLGYQQKRLEMFRRSHSKCYPLVK